VAAAIIPEKALGRIGQIPSPRLQTIRLIPETAMRWFSMTAVLLFGLCGHQAGARNVGVQAIGLEKFSSRDADILAGQMATVPRPMELAVLPFEFRGKAFAGSRTIGFDDPVFANTRRVATHVLENNPSTFTLSIHLYFAHPGDKRPIFRHGAFARTSSGGFENNSRDDVAFRDEIRSRALRTAEFLNGLRAWAAQRGLDDRLRLVTIPELEDGATPRQWLDARRFIQETYASRGAESSYRRSVDGGDRSRPPGFPYEKHGEPSTITKQIDSGDTYSNDGIDIAWRNLPVATSSSITLDDFCASAATAAAGGKTTLYWRSSFNGPRGTQPYARSTLRPFTNKQTGPNERTALWIYLNGFTNTAKQGGPTTKG
jgi:hypothetical protein